MPDGCPEFVSDLLPSVDGLYLGEETTPRRWDGRRLINLDMSKATIGVLATTQGGLGKILSPTWSNDYILVYKTATDTFVMEAKPTGGTGAAKQLFISSNRITQGISLTRYYWLEGSVAVLYAADANMRLPAGAFKKLTVNVYVNNHSGPPYDTVTLMKNGVATALTVTISPAGQTGYFTCTADVSFAADDEACLRIVSSSAGTGNIILSVRLDFEFGQGI